MNWIACTGAVAALAATSVADVSVTDFESGPDGWSISGRENIYPTGGNTGANMGDVLVDVFGADVRNNTNANFLGDLTRYGQMELSIDVKTNSIGKFGFEQARELVVELRDYDNDNGLPWTSVWYSLGVIAQSVSQADEDGWVTYAVTIDDPTATALPAGWGGYGDEDLQTGEPFLPADRTFASVLQSVDELAFTTFVPGFFFGFTDFDVQVDNIAIRTVPSPGAGGLALLGAGVGLARRRR